MDARPLPDLSDAALAASGRRVFEIERDALAAVAARIDGAFTAACRPLALERSATMSAWARSMPMTRWPAACSWRQTAAPIPEAEPVTTVVGMKCLLEMKGAPVRVILQYVEALAARASSARTRRLRGARPYNSRLQMVPPLTPGSPSR